MSDRQRGEQFQQILNQIQEARNRAYQTINRALIDLYWNIGQYISNQVKQANWGKGVVNQLALFIKEKEPEIKGFSDKNLWRMKQFYETYQRDEKLAAVRRELSWTHNRIIMGSCKSPEEREFYLQQSVKERYSTRELERQINSGVFERTLLGNEKLSPVVRELSQQTSDVFKDSYVFEFLNLPKVYSENELQKALIHSLKEFILEIGRDFSFIGQDYRLQVGNSDFYTDLLFYHRELRCLVVFELKIDTFKPEYMGQLEFYLEALDRDVRKEHENPSIGVLMCREKDDEVVEYALSRSLSPTVITEYETKLIPKEILRKKINDFYALLENQGEEKDDPIE